MGTILQIDTPYRLSNGSKADLGMISPTTVSLEYNCRLHPSQLNLAGVRNLPQNLPQNHRLQVWFTLLSRQPSCPDKILACLVSILIGLILFSPWAKDWNMDGPLQIVGDHGLKGGSGTNRSTLSEINVLFLTMAMNESLMIVVSTRFGRLSRLLVLLCDATLYMPQLAIMTSVMSPVQSASISFVTIIICLTTFLARPCFRKSLLQRVIKRLVSHTAAQVNKSWKT